jgi:hypothetical protein
MCYYNRLCGLVDTASDFDILFATVSARFFKAARRARFASLSAQFFLLNSFGFPTQKKENLLVTRKKKRNLLYKKRPITNINNMSDNEGGDATAEVDFNDDLFTCANVRLFVHMCTCLCIDLFTLSLSLSLSLRDFFFVLFCCTGGV